MLTEKMESHKMEGEEGGRQERKWKKVREKSVKRGKAWEVGRGTPEYRSRESIVD